MNKKIGWIRFSGLIIGPILGSGIILLPTMVYEKAGFWSLPAWVLISVLGLFFAFIFSFLTLLFPGEAGVSNAIEYVFGKLVKILSAGYLIGAGLFGPVAVLLIAERYANLSGLLSSTTFTLISLLLCTCLLMMSITSIGRAALVLSSVAAILLVSGGAMALIYHSKFDVVRQPFEFSVFGNAMLLLFWGLVGWEVIGSFSGEIKDPKHTYTKAALFSAFIITTVSLVVAGAVQFADIDSLGSPVADVAMIIKPIAGGLNTYVFGGLVFALCINTYLSFVGSIARLAASLADDNILPRVLNRRTKNNSAYILIAIMTLVHVFQILLVKIGLMTMESLVAVADVFFLLNALVGLLAAMVIFERRWLKICTGVLAACFFSILLFSSSLLLVTISLISFFVLFAGRPYLTVAD
ncbi:MAG: hypothetical protein C0603_04480 [Denitrovibrio sp.]|nr:MAG: hypothetical protein C0603_04480 [Denitrovibrio sp.]